MKRFLKYDTEEAKKGIGPADKNGVIRNDISGGGGAQPDWNQNDEAAADYVKNRPFYTGDPVVTVLVEEQTVAFSDMGGVYGVQGWPTEFDAVVGKTYTVSWDGTEYECECLSMQGMPCIGNLAVAGGEVDTGEPFIFMNQGAWVVGTNDTASEHSISVSSIVRPVTKIDEKYLPIATNDSVGVVKDNNYVFDLTKEQTKKTVKEWGIIAQDNRNNLFYDIGNGPVKAYKVYTDYTGSYLDIYHTPYGYIKYKPNSNGVYDWSNAENRYGSIRASSVYLTGDGNIDNDILLCVDATLGFDVKPIYNTYYGLKAKNIISDGYLEGHYLALKQQNQTYYYVFYVDENNNIIVYKRSYANSNPISQKQLATTDFSGKELYINSSTADSTKKFKITVDDSGTITATEVS